MNRFTTARDPSKQFRESGGVKFQLHQKYINMGFKWKGISPGSQIWTCNGYMINCTAQFACKNHSKLMFHVTTVLQTNGYFEQKVSFAPSCLLKRKVYRCFIYAKFNKLQCDNKIVWFQIKEDWEKYENVTPIPLFIYNVRYYIMKDKFKVTVFNLDPPDYR